jgi:AbrB family looped-hinge helix DNA binding protein
VVIPKAIHERFGLKKGSRVQVVDYGQMLALISLPDDPMDAWYGMFESDDSLTDELLAERAREQAREDISE